LADIRFPTPPETTHFGSWLDLVETTVIPRSPGALSADRLLIRLREQHVRTAWYYIWYYIQMILIDRYDSPYVRRVGVSLHVLAMSFELLPPSPFSQAPQASSI
jgi:hypothetical protein